ncbi:MAG: type II toxin-antitoxin system HicA family toxin [Ignavibacteriaceae bacterium]
MPKLKVLSGEDVIKIFKSFGFIVSVQRGSHIKLIRLLKDNVKQPITIPNHKELDKGTLKAIIRQASKYISEEELKNHFYTE